MAPILFAALAVVIGSSLPQQAPPRDPPKPPATQPAAAPAAPAVAPEAQQRIKELRQQAAQHRAAGDFDGAVAALEAAAQVDPSNAAGHQLVATYYWERAQKETALTPIQRATYISEGLAATDRALSVNPDYREALVYKSLLLRMQATAETDPDTRARLIAEADLLRNRAVEQARAGGAGTGGAVTARQAEPVDGVLPVRVGGNVKAPVKTKDVRPVYPADALAARVQGVVIIEATIDAAGKVRNAVVLRSIPMLDQAALEAVTQWEFTPTVVDSVPVPVIMTVTVNFTVGGRP